MKKRTVGLAWLCGGERQREIGSVGSIDLFFSDTHTMKVYKRRAPFLAPPAALRPACCRWHIRWWLIYLASTRIVGARVRATAGWFGGKSC